ncbi:MAG: sulfite exporter TauE/SafE family protein [Candidatus Coatesbacteria bacterium]
MPVLTSVGTSLCTVLANAASGTATYARQRRIDYRTGIVFAAEGAIDWRAVAFLAPGAILGAQLGARLASRTSGPWLARALGAALFLLGLRLLAVAL